MPWTEVNTALSMDDDRHLRNQIECADKINCKEKLNKEIQETEYDSARQRGKQEQEKDSGKMTKQKDREREERKRTRGKECTVCEGYHNHATEWCIYMVPHHQAFNHRRGTGSVYVCVQLCACVFSFCKTLTTGMPAGRDSICFKMKPVILRRKLSLNEIVD